MGFALLTNVARYVHMNYYYDTYQLQVYFIGGHKRVCIQCSYTFI